MFLIGEILAEKTKINEIPLELWGIIIIFVFITIGFVVSFRKKKLGGKIMLTAGLASGIFLLILGGFKNIDAALIYATPFVVSGLLLL